MTARISMVMVAVVLGLAGCAANRAAQDPADEAPEGRQTIHVENGMPASLRVFARVGGSETILGRVPADGEATLPLRVPTGGEMRFVARPSTAATSRAHVSEPIEIMPGQRVTWQLRFSPGVSGVPQMSTFHVLSCGDTMEC